VNLVFKNFGTTRAVNVVFHTGLMTAVTPNESAPVIGPNNDRPRRYSTNCVSAVGRLDD
jgi:hypothetical protein